MPTADSLNRLGVDLFLQGDLEGARLHYLAALQIDPNFLPGWANLAVVLGGQNKLTAAVACVRKVLNVAPHDGNQLNNLGNMLMRLKLYDESRAVMERAAGLMPDNPTVWYNLALLALREGKNAEGLVHFDRVIALGGDSATIRNDKAHALLAEGSNLGLALEFYEDRWAKMIHLPPWDYHIPEWQGQAPLVGKKILLHAEQGHGDTIMCARFCYETTMCEGAEVTLCLPNDMCSLFEGQFDGVQVLSMYDLSAEKAKTFDFHSPMYSAMRWLGIEQSDISPAPYLKAPQIIGPKVATPNCFNIGICWASGSRGGEYDWRRRVAPLELWLPLAELPDVQLYSLQIGPEAPDIATIGAEGLIIDETPQFKNWADTAAFLSQLDLVVTVDTAIAHLAGAMGKEVWMLSQHNNCWRWWNIDSESGRPWYSAVTIIRQEVPDDWKTQILKVRTRLLAQRQGLQVAA